MDVCRQLDLHPAQLSRLRSAATEDREALVVVDVDRVEDSCWQHAVNPVSRGALGRIQSRNVVETDIPDDKRGEHSREHVNRRYRGGYCLAARVEDAPVKIGDVVAEQG